MKSIVSIKKYQLELLKCHRTIDAFEKMVTNLKKASDDELPDLIAAIVQLA